MPSPSVKISAKAWVPAGPDDDKTARLHTAITINGQPFHLYAIAVRKADRGPQGARHPWCARDLAALYTFGEPGEPFETIKIEKRDYIIGMCPFC